MVCKDKWLAKINGEATYMGSPCIHGHDGKRYTRNGDCFLCRNAYNLNKSKKTGRKVGRPRKYETFVGPIKPKKKWPPQPPKPTNEFEYWIHRSRRKNKERRVIPYEHYLSLYTKYCPLLNIELEYKNHELSKMPKNYATLDKIDPSKGYVVGNIQILSQRANTLKSDATIDELKTLIANWELYV
jgi:hypothetical protein